MGQKTFFPPRESNTTNSYLNVFMMSKLIKNHHTVAFDEKDIVLRTNKDIDMVQASAVFVSGFLNSEY